MTYDSERDRHWNKEVQKKSQVSNSTLSWKNKKYDKPWNKKEYNQEKFNRNYDNKKQNKNDSKN